MVSENIDKPMVQSAKSSGTPRLFMWVVIIENIILILAALTLFFMGFILHQTKPGTKVVDMAMVCGQDRIKQFEDFQKIDINSVNNNNVIDVAEKNMKEIKNSKGSNQDATCQYLLYSYARYAYKVEDMKSSYHNLEKLTEQGLNPSLKFENVEGLRVIKAFAEANYNQPKQEE